MTGPSPVDDLESDERVTARELTRIARGGTLNLAGAVLSASMGFLQVVVVSRFFSQDDAGSLFAATSAFTILVTVGMLGTETGLARFQLPLKVQERFDEMGALRRLALGPVMSLSIVTSAVVFIAADSIGSLLGLETREHSALIRLMAISIPFATLGRLMLAETRSLGRMRPTVFIDKILRSTAQPLGAVAVGLAGGGLVALAGSWIAPYILVVILAIPTLPRHPASRHAPYKSPRIQTLRREFWLFTWPRSLASISQIAIQRFDIIVIAAVLGPSHAAIYTAATRFVVVGQFSVAAIQQVLQPRMSAMLARRQFDPLRKVFQTATAWNILVAWPMYTVVALGAGVYLEIFGDRYQSTDAELVVLVMAISMMLAVAAGPLDTLLLMAGHSAASTVNALVALGINVTLCLMLIPEMGILGASLAWGGAVVVRNLLTYIQVRRSLSISPFSRPVGVAAVLPLASLGLPLGLISARASLTFVQFLLVVVVCTVVYCLALWTARDTLNLRPLMSVLSIKRA